MKWQRRKRSLCYTVLCEWCGVTKKTARHDRITCSGKCRQRMAAFVREFGWRPDKAPGDITAGAAIDLELLRLIRAERQRREADYLLKGRVVPKSGR